MILLYIILKDILYCFKQLAEALSHIHSQNRIHGNISLPNILLRENTFKLSNNFTSTSSSSFSAYIPELQEKSDNFTSSIDIWCLGLTMYLYSTNQLLNDLNEESFFNFPPIRTVSNELNDLILLCLSRDPANRPTSDKILHMNIIINCLAYEQSLIKTKQAQLNINEIDSYQKLNNNNIPPAPSTAPTPPTENIKQSIVYCFLFLYYILVGINVINDAINDIESNEIDKKIDGIVKLSRQVLHSILLHIMIIIIIVLFE